VALPSTSGSAVSVTSNERAHTTAATSSSLGAITTTFGRFRKLFRRFVSPSVATMTSGVFCPHASTSVLPCFVDGASNDVASTIASEPWLTCEASAERSAALAALRLTF
jgi:hypothetical protein